jgi:membrane fusion protein (multidrug efflux system)
MKLAELAASPTARKRLVIAAAVGLVALVGGVRWYRFHSTHLVTENAAVDGDILTISSKVSGRVAAILVQDNTTVTAGTPLVQLEQDDLLVARSKARAAVAAAEGQLAEAKTALMLQRTQQPLDLASADAKVGDAVSKVKRAADAQAKAAQDVASARQALHVAEVERTAALRDRDRVRLLAKQDAVAQQALDTAEDRCRRAEAQASAAQAQYRAAQAMAAAAQADQDSLQYQQQVAQTGKRQAASGPLLVAMKAATVQRCEAQVAAAKADLADIERKLGETVIKAPVAGRTGKRSVQLGQLINANEPLLSLIPPTVWVTANLKETEMKGIAPGASAEVTVDALPGMAFAGTVESVQPATGARFSLLPPDNATGNFTKVVQHVPVRVSLKPQPHLDRLSPGLSAEVTISLQGS